MNDSSPSFWQRRVVAPIRAQMFQGTSPEKIALTLGVGAACGLFPFVGFTTILCAAVAAIFRLNQPIIHVVNQLLWPVQLAGIPLFVAAGAWLLGAEPVPIDPAEVARIFSESQREFWTRFGLAGLYALIAWTLAAPLIVWAFRCATLPALRKLSRK